MTPQAVWGIHTHKRYTIAPPSATQLLRPLQVESGDLTILKLFNKVVDYDVLTETCKNLSQAGIAFISLWIKNGPWETESSTKKTIELQEHLLSCGGMVCNSPYVPFEQTPLTASLHAMGVDFLARDEISGVLKIRGTSQGNIAEWNHKHFLEDSVFVLDGMNIVTEL